MNSDSGVGNKLPRRTVQVENPAFDATPVEFITGIITEEGIIDPQHIFHRSDTRS